MTSAATSSSPVPSKNSAANTRMAEVVGQKTDDQDGNSIYAYQWSHYRHMHSAGHVYPTQADGVLLTSDAVAWTLGAISEVIPAGTVAAPFDIHWINIEGLSDNAVYEIVLYYGAGGVETEIGRTRVTRNAVQSVAPSVPTQGRILPTGSRVSAAVAASGAGAKTATISLFYHTY